MINYEYLKYWKQEIEEIRLTKNLIKTNLIAYFKTKDIKYLEYLKNNIEDLQKLREKN